MSLVGIVVLLVAVYAAFKVVGALFRTIVWIAILLFAWWYFGPRVGVPFPF
jgi:hypothetical protein